MTNQSDSEMSWTEEENTENFGVKIENPFTFSAYVEPI